jgi:hypothetical protein
MRRKQIIFLVILMVVAAAGWYVYRMIQEKTPDEVNTTPDLSITATELIAAFDKDTASAGAAYLNKLIAVSGTVKTADTSALVLGEPGTESSVVCGLDRRHKDDYKNVKPGSVITVQGRCIGYEKGEEMLGVSLGTTVQLRSSGVKEKK